MSLFLTRRRMTLDVSLVHDSIRGAPTVWRSHGRYPALDEVDQDPDFHCRVAMRVQRVDSERLRISVAIDDLQLISCQFARDARLRNIDNARVVTGRQYQ